MDRKMRSRGIFPEQISTLDRLAFLGENTMGALTYRPAGEEYLDSRDLALIDLAQEVQAVLMDESHEVLSELARAGGSPGGARPKANVFFSPETDQMSTQSGLVQNAQDWLIKFPGDGDGVESCALEELFARAARKCQLEMMPTRFFQLPNGLTAFGTQRFDRRDGRRIHVHTLAGMLHANFRVPSVSYADFFRTVRRLTRDQRQLKKAVQRCAFNVLINNRDDHSKNISFLFDSNGEWALSPPYDLTFCSGYRGEHFMDISGEGLAPGRHHVMVAAQAAGISKGVASEAIDSILECCSPSGLIEMADGLPLSPGTLKTVLAAVKANHMRLALAK